MNRPEAPLTIIRGPCSLQEQRGVRAFDIATGQPGGVLQNTKDTRKMKEHRSPLILTDLFSF
jgi:hypothetical protein